MILSDYSVIYNVGFAEKKQEIAEFFYYDIAFNKTSSHDEEKSNSYIKVLNKIRQELLRKVQWIRKLLQITQYTLFFFSSLVVFM